MAEPTKPSGRSFRPSGAPRHPPLASRGVVIRPKTVVLAPRSASSPPPRSASTPSRSPSSPPARPTASGYLPALDGLRAVAVVAVVAYHLERLNGGFLGVDVFFVVSGFLITRLLLAERDSTGTIALRSFWSRRFRRLLPALLVVLVAVAIGSKAWLPPWRLTSIRDDCLAALVYVANWRFVVSGQSYFSSGIVPSPVRHAWSLAIEEQYYLVWPLVVAGLGSLAGRWRRSARQVVAVASAVGAVGSGAWMALAASQGRDLSRIYFGTDTRAFALFVGAWLAASWDPTVARSSLAGQGWAERWPAIAAGIASAAFVLVAFALAGTEDRGFYRGGFQAVAVLATVLVGAMASGVGPLARALAVRPLVWLGRRSYGIYLWSWPVQVFAAEGVGLDGVALDATVVAVTVVLATLSHWLVEEPIRTGRRPAGLGDGVGRRPTVARRLPPAMSVGAVGLVAALLVGVAVGAPGAPDFTKVSDDEANAVALRPSSSRRAATADTTTTTIAVDDGPPGPFSEARTFVVDPAAQVDPTTIHGRPLKVLLVGDSIGWSLGFRVQGIPSSIELSDRALLGCGLLPRDARFIVGERDPELYPDTCLRQDEVEGYGLDWGPDVVLLWFGAWEVYDQEVDGRRFDVGTPEFAEVLEARVQDRVDRYRSLGLPTLIAAVPCFGPNAARLGKERHDRHRIAWVNARIRAVAKRNRGWVRIVDPTDALCEADGTARETTSDGAELRPDGAHFVAETAAWFWTTWLAGQLGAALDVPAPPTTTTTAVPTAAVATTTTVVTAPG